MVHFYTPWRNNIFIQSGFTGAAAAAALRTGDRALHNGWAAIVISWWLREEGLLWLQKRCQEEEQKKRNFCMPRPPS
ncbi:hypothetical protein BD324DRAFT_637157 [Kockovaella imperatae]|uniref:Uncharacterized protein n=1 Tax=Kockovaella imperatae TaxID=4999 RepID=A0A1Y1U892_9TREE|nr:hypothetical protein BD324DRAFT_637157 [Kockovaella imperatae]ORX34222.1 hypothetical protein BD324DRAFT_637157 [Kockovaella imperatae]